MEFSGRKRMHFHLNITPMIDIVFLLLIFFMLTSSFIDQRAIKIDLPETSHADEKVEEDIVISIDSEGKISLGTETLRLTELHESLKEKIGIATRKNVIIRGDRNVSFGTAVKVMDIVRETGAEGMTVVTELEGRK
jgi:biopolymer transport protein ExbD